MVKKNPPRFATTLALLALTLGIVAGFHWFAQRHHHRHPVTTTPTGVPGETVTTTTAPDEIFRRAFWRQPTSADEILHAERREWTVTTNAESIARWQWFLAVRPSPELLRHLRNPDTFGLAPLPTGTPARPWSTKAARHPAWFPATADSNFEILQSPSVGLTILYRATDNTLYATDQGGGFTPSAQPVVPPKS